jgi:hypothetical protein
VFGEATVVWLDAGGFSGDPTPVGEMQNDTLIEGMNRIGYAAANVGERELAAGVDKFLSRAGKAKFPFVSANLVTDPGGKPFIKPYVVHEIEVRGPADERPRRLRLGIIGFTRQKKEFLGATPDGRNVVTLAPAEAARRWLPELRKKSDLTVALVSMRYEDALEVAQAAQQAGAPLDFVLGGMADWVSRDEGSLLGPTKIAYSGNQGRQLGEVRVYLDGDRRVARSVFDPVWLTRDYPGDPDIESLVQTTMVNINDWYREHQTGGSPLAPIVIGSTYTGAGRCEKCHADPFKAFKGSAHFSALETLVKAGQQFNPDCLKCHTTGFGKPGGFVTQGATPQLANVQCEACHGPSSGHPEGVSDGFGRSGMGPCLVCHTRDNSPEFKFPPYWERIRH